MTSTDKIAGARTFLFVPGDRPARFDKALRSGAGQVIVDLEDAVGAGAKDEARAELRQWLSADKPVLVRVNSVDSPHFERDLVLCAHAGVAGLVLPKANERSVIKSLRPEKPVVALIESAEGIAEMHLVARTPGVVRLAMGAIDLAIDLGMGAEDRLVDPFRVQMTLASRIGGLPAPIDGVTPSFDDAGLIKSDVERAKALGFAGKLCIHPAQIEPAERAFAPTEAEVDWALRVISAIEAARGSAASVNGEMADKPMVDRARRILQAADYRAISAR